MTDRRIMHDIFIETQYKATFDTTYISKHTMLGIIHTPYSIL